MALINDPVTSSEPAQSTPCSRPRPLSPRISSRPSANVATPIGRLTKKTQCQLRAWVRSPPARRPREPPATETNTYALIARARSAASVNSVTMIARITEAWAAAPTPCRNRAAISAPWLGATPQSSEATVKIVRPERNTRLRPARSPSRPARSSRLPKVMRKALTTQVRLAWLKWRSRWIEGSATFTIVTSRTIMSCARQTTISVGQRRLAEGVGVGDERVMRLIGVPTCRLVDPELKWRPPPEIFGGTLRNYTEAASGCQTEIRHGDRNLPPDPAPATEARRCPA